MEDFPYREDPLYECSPRYGVLPYIEVQYKELTSTDHPLYSGSAIYHSTPRIAKKSLSVMIDFFDFFKHPSIDLRTVLQNEALNS